MIRNASPDDVSRIAEILIFSKRTNYRSIFQNDIVSFGEMQVLPLANHYLQNPQKLDELYVYDDGFVKGLVSVCGTQVTQLYVDPFFVGMGIGSELLKFAVRQFHCDHLWVLEKNIRAIRFYQKHGFVLTDQKQLEDGTDQYIVFMKR